MQYNKEEKQQIGNGLGLSIIKRIAEIYNHIFSISKNHNDEVIASISFTLFNN